MELRHLRYFVAVARELNFRRAAKTLHIAQPPLSMQIKVLENELGVQLFDRSSRSVSLTAAGSRFLVDALRIVSEARQAEIDVKRAAKGILGRLNIGFMLSTAHDLLGSAVKKFKAEYPEVELNLLDLTNSAQIKALEEDRLDIAFTRSRISRPELQTEILSEEPMMLMVPSNDPLAKKSRLSWKDLKGRSIITLHPDQALGFYDNFFARCQAANIPVVTGQFANDLHTEMWLVSIGMGFAPTSLTLSHIRRPNISFCELPLDLPKVQTAMSWKKNKPSPATANFLTIIRQFVPKK
jgi:DNA-binding transcriptional LysR family regulator